MDFDRNTDYPNTREGHRPIEFPQAESSRCRRVPIVGTTGSNVAWTRAEDDNDDSDEMSESDDDSYDSDDMDEGEEEDEECLVIKEDGKEGYWLQRTLRDAIYGRVRYALAVRRRDVTRSDGQRQQRSGEMVAWDVVRGEKCAVKEMAWMKIRRLKSRCEEDPIKEVRAMQFIQRHYEQTHPNGTYQMSRAMLDTRVMMSRDVLDDGRFMYSVMPFCDGGEFFDHVVNEETGMATVLSENDARRWFVQILEGIETMQRVGVVHRDMSLENLMIHGNDCLIIDMGMTLRIPYENVTADHVNDIIPPEQRGERKLMGPVARCGKIKYMSPEIFRNRRPFDGHAVDLWAVGVMLFMMVTGFPPWDRPDATDARYLHICRRGCLEQICVTWDLGLSPQIMDLLQRMMWEKPIDRLSLEQIRAHPWMRGEGSKELT